MKKYNILLTVLVLCAISASATPVSKSKAQAIATSFFQKNSKRAKAKGAVAMFSKEYASYKDAPTAFYAFSSGESVVFVSAEDEMPAILGYSERADLDNLPPAMEWLLNSYAQLTDAVRNGEIEAPKLYASADAAGPLCKTIWDQVEPFNSICPVFDGELSANGCLSTAFAQVMKYYEWPKKAEGTTPEYYSNEVDIIPSVNLSDHVYNWADMLDDYTGTYTPEQGQAVAQLCYDVAVASKMNFSPKGSGTNLYVGANALRTYFGYSKDMYLEYPGFYTEEEWVIKLKNEISQKRPLLFSGNNIHNVVQGHCFILDGYNAEGLFHVNWGWGGEDNDYFLITSLTPKGQGVGGGDKGANYIFDMHTIFNCVPDTTGTSVPAENYRFNYTCLEGTGGDNIEVRGFENKSLDDFQGKLALQFIDKDGKVASRQTLVPDYSVGYLKVAPNIKVSLKDFDFSSIADGKYGTKLVAMSNVTDKEFPTVNEKNNISVVVENGKLKTVLNSDVLLEGEIVNCELVYVDDSSLKVKIEAEVTNSGDSTYVYSDNHYLNIECLVHDLNGSDTGWTDKYYYKKDIKAGDKAKFECTMEMFLFFDGQLEEQVVKVNLNYPNGRLDEKEYSLKDLMATAINDAKADKELNSAPAYNTMGQRVNSKTTKGIIIQNGKKTLGL